MKTGNIIEAMEAAKAGARVRRLVGDRGKRASMWRTVEDGYDYQTMSVNDILGIWEIDDQPRRWPSIVEAVKHMEKTGDWGRSVVMDYWVKRGSGANSILVETGDCSRMRSHAEYFTSEWETKPAEDK